MYSITNFTYALSLGMVISTNPYSHIYAVAPLWKKQQVKPYWLAVPIGVLGNIENGVQVQCAYNYGDHVLLLHPVDYLRSGGSSLCFILGGATPHLFMGNSVSDYVASAQWDEDNLSVDTFHGFEFVQRAIHLEKYTPTAAGHGSADMLPGDFEATGARTSLMVGDYLIGMRGLDAEVFIDTIYRRIVENSVLKTSTTVCGISDIALVGNTTINSVYTRGHVAKIVEEDQEKITDVASSDTVKADWYRTVEQSGDLLYGSQKTLLAEDGRTPLAKDYTGYDGARYIYTANKLYIGKIPSMESPVYCGPIVHKQQDKTEILTDNLSRQLVPHELKSKEVETCWATKINEKLVANNKELLIDSWYPSSFLSEDLAEYPDDDTSVVLEDSLREEDIRINRQHSYISFEDDGSIKLVDGWGSYILLSRGNVEIHAMNNLFMVSARDMLSFAGANRTEYANRDLSIQAYRGDLRMLAGNGVKLNAEGEESNVTIECRNQVRVITDSYKNDASSVVFTVRSSDTQAIGGRVFQVLVPGGQINLSGNDIRLNGDNLAFTAAASALILSGNALFSGNILVRGGMHCDGGTTTVDVIAPDGKTQSRTFTEAGGDIINKRGGIRVSGDVITGGQLLAGGTVCGGSFCLTTQGTQKEINTTRNLDKVLSAIRNLPTLTVNVPNFDDESIKKLIAVDNLTDYRFSFGRESKNCLFVVPHSLPKNGTTTVTNTGYIDAKNIKSYIYPGIGFWESSGLKLNGPDTIGFNRLPNALDNKAD